jgi:hypothetical protein
MEKLLLFSFVFVCLLARVAAAAAAAADELFNLIEGKLFCPIRCKLEFRIDADGMYCMALPALIHSLSFFFFSFFKALFFLSR